MAKRCTGGLGDFADINVIWTNIGDVFKTCMPNKAAFTSRRLGQLLKEQDLRSHLINMCYSSKEE